MTTAFADASLTPVRDLLSLTGRRAVVTGGAQGLGKAIAARLAEAGSDVLIGDVNADLAKETAAGIADRFPVRALGLGMDVSDAGSVRLGAQEALESFGGIDIWVNNAGIFPSVPVLQTSDSTWEQVFAVNTRGVFNGSREAARHMSNGKNGGVIINIVSTAGFGGTAPGLSAYVGSKHAVRGMTKQMALEFAPMGIRVLGVAPTFVPTEGNMAAAAQHAPSSGTETMDVMTNSLIGRIGTPDDIARVVLFCASDLSTIMTGSTLLADAGQTI
ncbi:NAD(P)-dependent dehydrogenase (short-subunit alcohol dehydrogenase family) [Paenarthrobacter nicotinovorans]|uniref:SDR family oxidoreductase n=1 Tax=Paenarthrobacter nicotinovorans TaxID=29320 RepID=A0ABV0GXT1_PAENI|nr:MULTISPECIES: SDR family oxidoreductase [Micrococcaceae]MDR6436621.1 NAD(P)-dependent dehydrogenase (short-subunit alcohol dehydrogenase family) [Paenarthrobacter nicotinovorans]SCZ57116.1 NAD(P)-dependent dehydrogenase, short-chain alcohol dehydrogenase family [Arthrobacter sp. UNCCL28]